MSNTTSTPDHAANTGYTPVFNDTVRTVVYIIGLVAVIVGAGFTAFGNPEVGDYVTTVGGLIASGFGVAYNPLRMAGK
ncbi:hypothetical protein DWZ85_02270 [Bifidobacterium longum]|uniref:DoxX n=1 Tax=Bifidobacterium pseudocatenulatum TaxID=28026 RepID=A0AAQ0LWR3_BIFPS|nr:MULTISPECIES: hypothetical protein [Bifidobacterium]RHL96180.1 hypothetical protein DWZ91_04490 [Bifidobacterium pseudocatenulatum]RHM01756.1 hypothetical protein DWZ85_02270 [Bifidobacterium longum]